MTVQIIYAKKHFVLQLFSFSSLEAIAIEER